MSVSADVLDRLIVPDEIIAFIKIMVHIGMLDDEDNLIHFLEKPWHWKVEFDLWVAFGQPLGEDDEGYDEFWNEIQKLVGLT